MFARSTNDGIKKIICVQKSVRNIHLLRLLSLTSNNMPGVIDINWTV